MFIIKPLWLNLRKYENFPRNMEKGWKKGNCRDTRLYTYCKWVWKQCYRVHDMSHIEAKYKS